MMKLFTKILAGCCALAMVFSLAACKDTPADEPDSTGDAAVNLSEVTPGETVAQADDMSETAPEEDSAQTPADTEEAQSQNGQTPPSTEKNTAASPNSGKDLSKTEVLALYQAGTKKSSLKRTKYNRQLTYGKLWSPGNFDNAQFDLVEDKEKAAPIFNGTDTASKAVTLPTLQESLVESATCKEAGVLGAVVGVIGSLEATEAVKLIAGVGEPLVARMLTVDALTMNIRRVPLPNHVPDCPVCGEQPTITAIDPANYIQPACAI